jgi:transposase-like protein
MTLVDLDNLFDTDEKCRELLVRLRWPNGPECPRCHAKAAELATEKQLFYCKDCDYQFSVTAGTVFNDSHLPLRTWFTVALLLCEARKGMSANQVKRTVGVSYKTAWYLCHRIRSAMQEAQKMMDGIVEVDETYVGGKKSGSRTGYGRGVDGKVPVIGIRQRGGNVKYIRVNDVKADTLREIIHDNISEDVEFIMTDEFPSYPFAMGETLRPKHKTIRHKDKRYVDGIVHTNTVENAFSLFKRGVIGTWHKISVKHMQAYLNEMAFRFNRRKNHDLFIDTLRHMVTAPVLTFETLTA